MYVQVRDIDYLYFFVVSFIIILFLFGEKKDSMWEYLFREIKKQSSSSSKKWRLSREKEGLIHYSSHAYKAFTAGVVGVQKGRRRRL